MASFFYCLEILIVYLLVEASLFKYRLLITTLLLLVVLLVALLLVILLVLLLNTCNLQGSHKVAILAE